MSPRRLRRLLHVAGFNYVKGPHTVAAAIDRLAGVDLDFELTWVCRTDEHAAVRALLSERASARTRLIGWMPEETLREVYDGHGIFIYPPLFDGFGKVFLEAMARALCVIGTPAGGMRDVIADGRNGMIVPFADPDAIVQRIQALWNDPVRAGEISRAARKSAVQHSWERVARETHEFYERILALPRRSA
jgi:glycosyltransferase involved in cell wall biosynthesis